MTSELLEFGGRIQHQREIAAALVAMGEEIGFDFVASDTVTQDEIAVGDVVVRFERDGELMRRMRLMRRIVRATTEFFDRNAGLHFHFQ